MKTYLKAPDSYTYATEDTRARVCNGAGPEGLGWLVPDTLYGLKITDAADVHDWMYSLGLSLQDKHDADFLFLVNMIRIINKETTKTTGIGCILRWLRALRAVTYFEAVQSFGHHAFFQGGKDEDVS